AGAPGARGGPPLVRLAGADFAGGAKDRYGALYDGEAVNYVYARPTGALASMSAAFRIERVPAAAQFLYLRARDDDGQGACSVAVTLNGAPVHEGANPFPERRWAVHRFEIAPGLLRAGSNELIIANTESAGEAGMPPWFMVAAAAIADADYTWAPEVTRDFFVTLPR